MRQAIFDHQSVFGEVEVAYDLYVENVRNVAADWEDSKIDKKD